MQKAAKLKENHATSYEIWRKTLQTTAKRNAKRSELEGNTAKRSEKQHNFAEILQTTVKHNENVRTCSEHTATFSETHCNTQRIEEHCKTNAEIDGKQCKKQRNCKKPCQKLRNLKENPANNSETQCKAQRTRGNTLQKRSEKQHNFAGPGPSDEQRQRQLYDAIRSQIVKRRRLTVYSSSVQRLWVEKTSKTHCPRT